MPNHPTRTPKLPPSDSQKRLLSPLYTQFSSPSTFASPDHNDHRMMESPANISPDGHRPLTAQESFEMAGIARGINGLVETPPRGTEGKGNGGGGVGEGGRKGSQAQKGILRQGQSRGFLDRDEILQPDYSKVQKLSNLYSLNPMDNLYTDAAANDTSLTTPNANNKSPIKTPSAPPKAYMQHDRQGILSLNVAEAGDRADDDADFRPPPSIHDKVVEEERAQAAYLTSASLEDGFGVRRRGTSGREDDLPSTMHAKLQAIFDVQSEIALMHAELEGVGGDESQSSEDEGIPSALSPGGGSTQAPSPGGLSGISPGTPLPPMTGKSGRGGLGGSPVKSPGPRASFGQAMGAAVERQGSRRDDQIDDIIDKLNNLSSMLHEFHALPNPNLDSIFPPDRSHRASPIDGRFRSSRQSTMRTKKTSMGAGDQPEGNAGGSGSGSGIGNGVKQKDAGEEAGGRKASGGPGPVKFKSPWERDSGSAATPGDGAKSPLSPSARPSTASISAPSGLNGAADSGTSSSSSPGDEKVDQRKPISSSTLAKGGSGPGQTKQSLLSRTLSNSFKNKQNTHSLRTALIASASAGSAVGSTTLQSLTSLPRTPVDEMSPPKMFGRLDEGIEGNEARDVGEAEVGVRKEGEGERPMPLRNWSAVLTP